MSSNPPYPDPALFGSDPNQGLNANSQNMSAGFASSRSPDQVPGSSPALQGFRAPQTTSPQPPTLGQIYQRGPSPPPWSFAPPPTNGAPFPPQNSVGQRPPLLNQSATSSGPFATGPLASLPNQAPRFPPNQMNQPPVSLPNPNAPFKQQLNSNPNQLSEQQVGSNPTVPISNPSGSFVNPNAVSNRGPFAPPNAPFVQPGGSVGTTNRPSYPPSSSFATPYAATDQPTPPQNAIPNQQRGSFAPPNATLNQHTGSFAPPNQTLNQQSGSFAPPTATLNQTPTSFTPPNATLNQQSGSFAPPPNVTRAAPQLGPPTFGLTQSVAYQASAPAAPGFPGQIVGPGLPQASPPYMPAAMGSGPTFKPSSMQPTQYAPQYPQFGGQVTSNGAPPFQNIQGLVEEFQSLSMATVPGSMEVTVDPNSLPRPSPNESIYPKQSPESNCHGKYLCLTNASLPNSQSLASRWHLPLGAVIHPLAEASPNEEVAIIDFGTSGIIRCRRCRTYINPYAVFTDNGRRWRCNVCGLNNEVPAEYYCPLDQNGRRTDADERPELCQGSVEFVAPAEYMVRPPMPPIYFFLIDVSLAAIKTGMLQIAMDTIRSCLDKLPGYPRTQIGFMTFDSTLHFYNLKSSLSQPQMMVVADLDDPFLPIPDDLLVNLSDSRSVVETLLNSLPTMFTENSSVESATGPALRAVFKIMSLLGGKLLLFQSTLPSLGAGHLKIRGDDPRIHGSDKEFSLRNPEDPFYKQMAAEFSKFQISVNIYAFVDKYIDLASLGTLAKYTAGQVYFYPSFKPHLDAEKFRYELARDLTRETAWEAVLRIRCGKGLRFNTYHGHFMLRSSDLMALPAVDCDKAFAMQLSLEESLLTSQTVYFQAALLYTSSNGERRIRIHTISVPVTSDLNEIYRTANTGAIVTLMSRLAIEKSLTLKLEDVRQQMVQAKLVKTLREYQSIHGAQHALTGRLIYPETLKLLPLYCLGLYKCLALQSGNAVSTLDESMSASFDMMTMPMSRLLNVLYPLMFRLDEYLTKGGDHTKSIQPMPLITRSLDPYGAFLLDNGLRFVVWLGSTVSTEFVVSLLGLEAGNQADLSQVVAVEQGNNLSAKFMTLLKSLRQSNPSLHQKCLFIRQGDHVREGLLVQRHLVEDRTSGSNGYTDWVSQIYKQVKQKA